MFDGASSRLRSQAGTIFSATPGTLSNLLNLCLDPDTDKQQMVAIVETDPSLLTEFLQMEKPARLESWHQPFDKNHFLCATAKLGMQLLQNPISTEQWQTVDSQWRLALVQRTAKKITHEVNNPLAVVQNYLKILSLKLGEEHEAQGSINIISSEILRAAEIVKRYNHIGDELQFQPGTADCNEAISELIEIFDRSYPDISFTKELDCKHPLVNLEADQFKQLLVNLFKNAIEAMNSHGELSIHSTADVSFPDSKYVEIEITDSGRGIDPELAANLFAPGVTSKSDEAGLGLAIVKEISARAGGMISFRTGSTGTSFRLLLPQLSTDSVEQKESS